MHPVYVCVYVYICVYEHVYVYGDGGGAYGARIMRDEDPVATHIHIIHTIIRIVSYPYPSRQCTIHISISYPFSQFLSYPNHTHTGPYSVNGVPLRRVNQRYVIATSTKVSLTGVDVSKVSLPYINTTLLIPYISFHNPYTVYHTPYTMHHTHHPD
ncbi:hypothetical protein EON63_24420 [archaeon]|nr:MAG: hypothetical protein EON63_24420 [archaeon]